jgi:heptaprenyl diphosphate synthase
VAATSPLLSLPGMQDELARVESALRKAVMTEDEALTQLASHLLSAGGKRLRPALAVAAGACAGTTPVSDSVIFGGAAVELVQLGSLYHDDVIDEADTRRGVESVNARWGNLRAILAGDFLLARASEIAASLGTEVAGLLAATIASMCEGEVRELTTAYSEQRTEASYLAAVAGKTATLFAAACRIGAIVTGQPEPAIEALTEYGHRFGMAFQVVDDVLDVVATEEELGKPAGNDVAQGVYTLPVIRALSSSDAGPELRGLLGRPLDAPDVEWARVLIKRTDAVEEALVVARTYEEEAVAALKGLEPGSAVEGLAAAATAVVPSAAAALS